jgi:hypothetical protein
MFNALHNSKARMVTSTKIKFRLPKKVKKRITVTKERVNINNYNLKIRFFN